MDRRQRGNFGTSIVWGRKLCMLCVCVCVCVRTFLDQRRWVKEFQTMKNPEEHALRHIPSDAGAIREDSSSQYYVICVPSFDR